MEAALPTTADISSPQTCEACVTRQPAEFASRALSNGHSTTTESMDTDPGDLGLIVTTCPAPSPLPTGSTVPDEQAWQRIESLEGYQIDELEITSHTPREVRETRNIILSADTSRQTDAALPTTADMSIPQTCEAQPSSSVEMSQLVHHVAHKHEHDTGLASLPNLPSRSSGKPPMDSRYGPPYSPMHTPSVLSHVFLLVALTSWLSRRTSIGRSPVSTFPCQITLKSSATEMSSLGFPGTPSMTSLRPICRVLSNASVVHTDLLNPSRARSLVALAPQPNLWVPILMASVIE